MVDSSRPQALLGQAQLGARVIQQDNALETTVAWRVATGACAKLQEDDPCFKMDRIAATKQTVMRGLGEMHLRYKLEKMATQYKLELDTKPPRIPYRETIRAKAEAQGKHKKQTGGHGQYGDVVLEIKPLPRGSGVRGEVAKDRSGGVAALDDGVLLSSW